MDKTKKIEAKKKRLNYLMNEVNKARKKAEAIEEEFLQELKRYREMRENNNKGD